MIGTRSRERSINIGLTVRTRACSIDEDKRERRDRDLADCADGKRPHSLFAESTKIDPETDAGRKAQRDRFPMAVDCGFAKKPIDASNEISRNPRIRGKAKREIAPRGNMAAIA